MYNYNFKYYKNNGVLEVSEVKNSNDWSYEDALKKKKILEDKKTVNLEDIDISEIKKEKKENKPIIEDEEVKKIDWLKVKPF